MSERVRARVKCGKLATGEQVKVTRQVVRMEGEGSERARRCVGVKMREMDC